MDQLDKERNEKRILLGQLNEERNKNRKLLEQLNNEKRKNEELAIKINDYENNKNNYLKQITELEKIIKMKDLEINNNNKNLTSTQSEGETIGILFNSVKQDMHRPISCKTTDSFAKIEEKIYNEYPEYKDYDTFLTANGQTLKRFKTIEENGIKDGNIILVNLLDEN